MRTFAATLLLSLAFAVPTGAAGWERVEAPAASGRAHVYRAAAALGEQGVWAAGYTYGFIGGAIEFRTLIQRWDDHGWWRVPTPDRETAPARDLLFDISAPGPARAWAVGSSAAGSAIRRHARSCCAGATRDGAARSPASRDSTADRRGR